MGSFKDVSPASPASTGPGVPLPVSTHGAPPRPGQAAGHIIRSAAPGHVSTTGCVSHVSHVSSVCSHDVTAGSGLGWAGALNLIICRNLEKAGPWLGPDQTVAASTSRAWARSDLISCGASHLVPSPSLHGHTSIWPSPSYLH